MCPMRAEKQRKGSNIMAQFTKNAIVASFIKLLNERPFDKIAVKDIVEDCGINRNTFYYYYQDIYALLEDIFETETSKVIEADRTFDTWENGLIQSVEFALKNKRAIYHVYNSIKREQLENYLYRITEDLMERFVRQQARGLTVAEEDIHLVALFYKHAAVGSVLEWLQRGMKDDAEHIIHRMGQLFEGNIRSTLQKAALKKDTKE